ncbi:MAG: sulfatase-like hydrolase/transferase, partial [Bacteroidales bacterium]|nr:sulfatase-like hydrolase/transferase [Bacteroidales bacterium]
MKIDNIIIGCSLLSCSLVQAQESSVHRPNVIYILMDDLGYGDLQCYGQQKIETPHIDKLREEGMKFTQH